jgi:AraC family transcriptional regulator
MVRPASRCVLEPGYFAVPGFEVRVGSHPAETSLPRHEHELPTICCVDHGRFVEHYAGKSVSCDPRMVKVTPAGEPHWNRFDTVDTLGLRIDVDDTRFGDAPALQRLLHERNFFQAGAFDGLARRLITEITAPDECAAVAAEALLLELLVQLARMPQHPRVRRAQWLRRADELVHERFAGSLSVSSVAAAVDVHPATLAREYRNTFGCSVGERIRGLRLAAAARALEEGTHELSRVALDAGFYDQSHFSRAFRRRFGVTPLQYRRRFLD